MKLVRSAAFAALLIAMTAFGANSVYDFTMNNIEGKPMPLSSLQGKVVLFVNVASKCGYTPQYEGLETLYKQYKDKGFVIVGVPANNFGGQEPETNEEIQQFCSRKYSVTFPMLAKVSVKGADITPLYEYLTTAKGGDVKWNFTKFLVGKDGKVIARFEPGVAPGSPEVISAIDKALQ
jgi:glutathione peroxidase